MSLAQSSIFSSFWLSIAGVIAVARAWISWIMQPWNAHLRECGSWWSLGGLDGNRPTLAVYGHVACRKKRKIGIKTPNSKALHCRHWTILIHYSSFSLFATWCTTFPRPIWGAEPCWTNRLHRIKRYCSEGHCCRVEAKWKRCRDA